MVKLSVLGQYNLVKYRHIKCTRTVQLGEVSSN
jgi:hypothetical protein